ncbi:hypothetical protein [Elizabethkingia anophelis]|uniref:Uncharacterized protein n=2 Tax=Elizabethkingia anophelis TaxID=1117645 RepID=A0A455ZFL4_9FLAO|nr:hypothetical protein [Elizabethkingia anophelis]ATC35572.1 hypothetical protein BAZ09_004805 [Elizabethkingia anophelis R26]ATC39210.1 hypothetical protein EAAG1_004805 [Elizabethkingia anophelis Ag1]ATC42891.1 hypothetical protein CMV41_04805 [Elizabethkingia anophelis]ATC46567.1 hypothetical protein CMV40_04805 [Elizabethkingia anophelis]ELR78605.1 hypothetical protein D505_12380 [Elizabethkingia anophelis R26]
MPKLNRTYTLEITPEQFLNSCSPVELQEISLLLNNNFYQSRLQSRQCRECGCSDYDCSQCIEKTNQACYWVEEDLCSVCIDNIDIKSIDKNNFIKFCLKYYELAKESEYKFVSQYYDREFIKNFYKEFGSNMILRDTQNILSKSFTRSPGYPIEIAEDFFKYLKEMSIAEAYKKMVNDILELNRNSDE